MCVFLLTKLNPSFSFVAQLFLSPERFSCGAPLCFLLVNQHAADQTNFSFIPPKSVAALAPAKLAAAADTRFSFSTPLDVVVLLVLLLWKYLA